MTETLSLLSLFLVGLLGSTHCIGMCGGIVGALSAGIMPGARRSVFPFLLAYNTGRILSYAVAGALAGALGAGLLGVVPPAWASATARLVSAAFMIALGLYLAGWWPGLQVLERWGGVLWRRIEPLARRLLPVTSVPRALAVGALWGWLPCGMVYAAIAAASASGSVPGGALRMIAFGFGTLPALLILGAGTARFAAFSRRSGVRRGAGVFILLLAAAMLFVPASAPVSHDGDGHAGMHHH